MSSTETPDLVNPSVDDPAFNKFSQYYTESRSEVVRIYMNDLGRSAALITRFLNDEEGYKTWGEVTKTIRIFAKYGVVAKDVHHFLHKENNPYDCAFVQLIIDKKKSARNFCKRGCQPDQEDDTPNGSPSDHMANSFSAGQSCQPTSESRFEMPPAQPECHSSGCDCYCCALWYHDVRTCICTGCQEVVSMNASTFSAVATRSSVRPPGSLPYTRQSHEREVYAQAPDQYSTHPDTKHLLGCPCDTCTEGQPTIN